MTEQERFNRRLAWGAGLAFAVLTGLVVFFSSWTVVSPGERGVLITLGRPAEHSVGAGLMFKPPLISRVTHISVRQQTEELTVDAFSSDLQHLSIHLNVLYRIPDASVVDIVTRYGGDPYQSLVVPRVNEALKEVTALETAERIAKNREKIKLHALEIARQKVGTALVVEDLVIANIKLSAELEKAIESKMVQEQEAAKAKFAQMQAETEARTAAIRAEGEAAAIRIRGEAIKANPGVIELKIVERWNGVSPLVVGDSGSASILLPVKGQ